MLVTTLALAVALWAAETPPQPGGSDASSADQAAIRRVISDYGRAIETKDLELFKTVKPDLSKDEEKRLRAAFDSVRTQVVKITITSLELVDRQATVRVSRRDTINTAIVSSFPQTLVMAKNAAGWAIVEIRK